MCIWIGTRLSLLRKAQPTLGCQMASCLCMRTGQLLENGLPLSGRAFASDGVALCSPSNCHYQARIHVTSWIINMRIEIKRRIFLAGLIGRAHPKVHSGLPGQVVQIIFLSMYTPCTMIPHLGEMKEMRPNSRHQRCQTAQLIIQGMI